MDIESMSFIVQAPSICQRDVAMAEVALGVQFPKDYSDFLLMHNGGVSKLCVCDVPSVRVRHWCSLCVAPNHPSLVSLIRYNEILRADTGCDSGLAIADDVSDYPIVFKLKGEGRGRLGVWIAGIDSLEDTELVFASFSDLIRHLRQTDDFI